MKNFYYYIFKFLIIHVLYLLLIFFIDPLNFFNRVKEQNLPVPIEKRLTNMMSNSINISFNTAQLINNHHKKIVLGDSRANTLININKNLKKEDYYKIIYKRSLSIEELEFIRTSTNLLDNVDEVILMLNFNQFSDNNNINNLAKQIKIFDSLTFLTYAYNFDTFKVSLILLPLKIINIFNENFFEELYEFYQKIKYQDLSRKLKKWETHLQFTSTRDFENYQYSSRYETVIEKIVEKCNSENIKLTIIIVPHHIDNIELQINKYSLSQQREDFFSFMNSLNTLVINYEYKENTMIYNDELFNDTMHSGNILREIISNEIISNKFVIGKRNGSKHFFESAIW